MPEEAEIPRLVMEAWNRRDLEGIVALADPDIEYINSPDAVEPGTRRGHEGLRNVLQSQWEGMPGSRQVVDRIYVRGEEIISAGRVSMQMPGSAAGIESEALLSWRFRDGRVIRLQVLGAGAGFAEALEAAGLPEPEGGP
jgi:ketosteroid isomerase-like protein